MGDCGGSVLCVPVCAGYGCNKRIAFGITGVIDETPVCK